MSATGNEYEVEMILRAKVVKERRAKVWRYCVKWKNYSHKENTWEPAESFEDGSEHFLQNFWKRVSVNGRDIEDLSKFKENEEFFPSGPPRGVGKKRAKAGADEHSSHTSAPKRTKDSAKEVQPLSDEDEDLQGKRRRAADAAIDEEEPALKRKRSSRGQPRRNTTEDSPERESRRRSGPDPHQRASTVNGSSKKLSSRRRSGSRRRPGPAKVDTEIQEASLSDHNYPDTESNHSEEVPEAALLPASPAEILLGEEEDNAAQPMQEDDHPSNRFVPTSLLHPELEPSIPQSRIPAHRDRQANSKVRLFDQPLVDAGYEGAILAKRQFMKSTSDSVSAPPGPSSSANATGSNAHSARPKPGPGRSSSGFRPTPHVVVHQVGVVRGSTLVKSRTATSPIDVDSQQDDSGVTFANGMDIDVEIPGLDSLVLAPAPQPLEARPGGEELLQLSGYIPSEGAALSDYDEDAQGEDDPDVVKPQPPETSSESPAATENKAKSAEPEAPSKESIATWKQPTIFGPLTIGRETKKVPETPTSCEAESPRTTLFLALDSAVSVPVILRDVTPRGSKLDVMGTSPKGPPGKFYKGDYAYHLVDALRMEGSCARLAIDPSADAAQKQHLQRFKGRLLEGELFVGMIGMTLLVICASENMALGQKLELPPVLIGLGDTLVVAHVRIENYMAYAQAAEHADGGRW